MLGFINRLNLHNRYALEDLNLPCGFSNINAKNPPLNLQNQYVLEDIHLPCEFGRYLVLEPRQKLHEYIYAKTRTQNPEGHKLNLKIITNNFPVEKTWRQKFFFKLY
jgi:hypothetical protein